MSATTLEAAPLEAQRRLVRNETLIGVVGNGLIAAIVVSLLYAAQQRIPLFGRDGGAFGLVPGTFMFTLGLTVGLTLTIRGRVRKGRVPRLLGGAGFSLGAGLPGNVVARALLLALIAEFCLVPVTLGLLWLVAPREWSFHAVLALNVAYFMLLAALVVPVVAWRALRDEA